MADNRVSPLSESPPPSTPSPQPPQSPVPSTRVRPKTAASVSSSQSPPQVDSRASSARRVRHGDFVQSPPPSSKQDSFVQAEDTKTGAAAAPVEIGTAGSAESVGKDAPMVGEEKTKPARPKMMGKGLSSVQLRTLSSAEQRKLFFHSVREGNTDLVLMLIKNDSSLVSELDDQLMSGLHYAVKSDRVGVVAALIQAGANVNMKGREGSRPLHVAANFNQIGALKELLSSRKVRVDATDDRGQTALHVACRRNHEEVVQILLGHKANPQLKELDGTSVLHLPSRRNNLQLCQILTNDTALISCRDKHGVTPLMVAASESGEELLSHFVSVCKLSDKNIVQMLNIKDAEGNSAMHYAARSDKPSMIQGLKNCGADINIRNLENSTPLHAASALGHKESVIKLLELGADPNQQDKLGRTPLHSCAISKQEEICGILLKAGSDPQAADAEFMTPFHWACRRNQLNEAAHLADADLDVIAATDIQMRTGLHWAVLAGSIELVNYLLDKAAELPEGCETVLNASDAQDKYPVHYAVEVGNTELLVALLSRGADFHVVDMEGRTPVQLAVKMGCIELVQNIFEHSEKLKHQALKHRDMSGMTSLLIAAEQGHSELFEYLLEQGADFMVKDEIGRTALMLSVGSGHHEIASVMIDKGVDVNASDSSRNTALHYACKHEDSDASCVELLLKNGAQLQQNYNGETPVDVAVLNNNNPAIQLFFSDAHRTWVMTYRKENGYTHLDVLIQHSPQTAELILNQAMTESGADHMDKNFMVVYNFTDLDPGPDDPASAHRRYLALRTMVKRRRVELLEHPVCQALIESKWAVARYFFWFDLLCYAVFLCCLTAFVADNGPLPLWEIDTQTGCRNYTTDGVSSGTRQKLTNPTLILEKAIVIGILSIRLVIETVKVAFKRLQYFKNYENFFFIVLYIFTFIFVYPPDSEPCQYNWICGMFSVIMAWCLLIFQFEHLPKIGIYSLMFQQVIVSLVKVLVIFSFCIIGFALAFNIGMVAQTPFKYITYSILKTFDMTVGELDFVTYFISNSYGGMQTGLLVVFVIFVIIMPIGLMNLLVGIAVGDIDGISKEASLKLIDIRITLFYELETNLPRYFQRRLHRRFIQVYPNRIGNSVSEYLWPYGAQYRDWVQRCADARAETSNEERLILMESNIQQLNSKLEEIKKTISR
ncbi:hypothetical protein BOX15_Mlig025935g2 [Macrostomum lignano]|uniref:Ion transport domain-containing protein n=1 Tax=Macrostomum lignano TaxID=282301 RepID=A0A267FPG6_9PLAT|nr:hypothetical protein BOX15_Mlig025935g2 [Macrostomum lignano]